MPADVLGVVDVLPRDFLKYEWCLKNVESSFNEALKIFNSPEFVTKAGWKKECENEDKDTIYSKHWPSGKLFALRCELPGDVKTVFEDNWDGVDHLAEWNSNIVVSSRFATLTEHVDIVHYGNPEILVVKGRDYAVVRMNREVDGGFMTVGRSVDIPEIPENKNFVRGELVLGAGRFTAKPSNPNVTVIDYVMCMNLKGYIPKTISNQFMAKLMLNDLAENKKHMNQLINKSAS